MIKQRNGQIVDTPCRQDRFIRILYNSTLGRICLRPLLSPWVSKVAGKILSKPISRVLIRPFIRANHINMSDYEATAYESYNQFFSRKIRPELRPIDPDPRHLIAPCDSKLTVLKISSDCRFTLKNTTYTVQSLLRNQALADRFCGGYALIFRLSVEDYHRYCFIADGTLDEQVSIPGFLHTVNPIACESVPVYKENSREYTILHTKEFGDVAIIEVGALLVGKIVNHPVQGPVARGQEKGYFQFGGSTVVLLLRENTVQLDSDILANARENAETLVRMGEKIGISLC